MDDETAKAIFKELHLMDTTLPSPLAAAEAELSTLRARVDALEAERAKMADALRDLNAAIDTMWNDGRRTDTDRRVFHERAICAAQQQCKAALSPATAYEAVVEAAMRERHLAVTQGNTSARQKAYEELHQKCDQLAKERQP
jgi:hypothetical protein